MSSVKEINGVKVLATQLEGADGKTLRTAVDQLKDKLGSGVILLAAVEGEKISLVAGVTKDLIDRFNAGELVRLASEVLGGKGGGRADMAQGGGTNPGALNEAFAAAEAWAKDK